MLKKTLEKIAGWFQPAADKIQKWDCPALRVFNQQLWDMLDDKLKESISALATVLYQKYGEQKARDIVADIKSRLEKLLK